MAKNVWNIPGTTKTKFGYRHCHYGPDMDGSSRDFEWISSERSGSAPNDNAGWFALCVVEPEAGWLGPYLTEAEAIDAATDPDIFARLCQYEEHDDEDLGSRSLLTLQPIRNRK